MVESVAAKQQKLDQVSGDVPSGDVETSRQMRKSETFVDGANVGHAIAGVDDDAGQQPLRVKGENSLKSSL